MAEFIKQDQVEDYNNDGYNVLLPINHFYKDQNKNELMKMQNFSWRFKFKNAEKLNSIKGIDSKEFWLDLFKNDEQIKETFKQALGRQRG